MTERKTGVVIMGLVALSALYAGVAANKDSLLTFATKYVPQGMPLLGAFILVTLTIGPSFGAVLAYLLKAPANSEETDPNAPLIPPAVDPGDAPIPPAA